MIFFLSLDLWEYEMGFHFVGMCFEIANSLFGCSILYNQFIVWLLALHEWNTLGCGLPIEFYPLYSLLVMF